MATFKFSDYNIVGQTPQYSAEKYFYDKFPETNICSELEAQLPLIKKAMDAALLRKNLNFNEGLPNGKEIRNAFFYFSRDKYREKRAMVTDFTCVKGTVGPSLATPTNNTNGVTNQTAPTPTGTGLNLGNVTGNNPIASSNAVVGPNNAVKEEIDSMAITNIPNNVKNIFSDKKNIFIAIGLLLAVGTVVVYKMKK